MCCSVCSSENSRYFSCCQGQNVLLEIWKLSIWKFHRALEICMNSNISLNSRQSIKMLTLMSCETRRHTPPWPRGTNSCKTHFQYYDDKAPSCLQSSKSHRKASFIFCSPLLPMGGHHLDRRVLTGWIQIWFDTPTENITGLPNKQDQSEQIREIYRVLALHRNMWNMKDTLADFVRVPKRCLKSPKCPLSLLLMC